MRAVSTENASIRPVGAFRTRIALLARFANNANAYRSLYHQRLAERAQIAATSLFAWRVAAGSVAMTSIAQVVPFAARAAASPTTTVPAKRIEIVLVRCPGVTPKPSAAWVVTKICIVPLTNAAPTTNVQAQTAATAKRPKIAAEDNFAARVSVPPSRSQGRYVIHNNPALHLLCVWPTLLMARAIVTSAVRSPGPSRTKSPLVPTTKTAVQPVSRPFRIVHFHSA